MPDFYAQQAEDLIVDEMLGRKPCGFYVDIGANDPVFLSNTKRFYDRGWNGINIEPNPELFKRIRKDRPRDINHNIGVSDKAGILPFYIYDPHQLSSFKKMTGVIELLRNRNTIYKETIMVPVKPLSMILSKVIEEIDFMSVDVEGMEIAVMETNNWNKHRPKVLIVEITYNTKAILDYAFSIGYDLAYKNFINAIFVDKEHKHEMAKWMPRWLPGYVP